MRLAKLLAVGALVALMLVPASTARAERSVADLSITITDEPDPVLYLLNVTYTATVSNVGPDDATSVRVRLSPYPDLPFVSGGVSQGSWSYSGGILRASLGTIEPGKFAMVTLVVTASNRILMRGTVSSPSKDPVPENNAWTEWTAVVDASPPPTTDPTPSGGVSTGEGGTAGGGVAGWISASLLLAATGLVVARRRAHRA